MQRRLDLLHQKWRVCLSGLRTLVQLRSDHLDSLRRAVVSHLLHQGRLIYLSDLRTLVQLRSGHLDSLRRDVVSHLLRQGFWAPVLRNFRRLPVAR